MGIIRIEDTLLARLIEDCLESLDNIGGITHRHCSVSEDRCIATKMCEASEYFFASVSRCLDAMRTDWSHVGIRLGCFMSYDAGSANMLRRTGIPATGNFEEWRAVTFTSRTVEGPLGMRVPFVDVVTHRIDLSYDKLYVTALDIEAVRSVIDSLRALEQAADRYVSQVDIFVSSTSLLGRYADSVKRYIRSTHIRIMRRIADLASEMHRSFSRYVSEYDSMYEGNDYLIDENGLESLIETIRANVRNIAQEVYEADQCIERLNEKNVPVVRLEDDVSSASTQYIRSIIGEINDLTYIEGRGRNGLQQYTDDLDILYRYADLFGRSCGRGIMTSDTTRLTGLSDRIMTRRQYDVASCFERAGITVDGTYDNNVIDDLRRELRHDPDLASRFRSVQITDGSMQGMIRYYTALLQEGADSTDAANKALDRMFERPDWMEQLNVAVNSGNTYLADPVNFIRSAENMPEDVTSAAIEWGKMIANGDHGYNKDDADLRWGPNDYDCCTYAVCMFTDGAGIDIPHGPDNTFAVHDMYEHMCDYGFSKVPFHNDCSELLPGDILVINPNGDTAHAEVYIGEGRTLHATRFKAAADDSPGDQQRAVLESNRNIKDGYTLEQWGEYFDETFGTNIRGSDYQEDGIPYVGEITGYRIAKPGSNEYIDAGNRGDVAFVIRYTGGIPVNN